LQSVPSFLAPAQVIVYHSRIMHSVRSPHIGKGLLMIVLHAHLPYIRYPEHENFLEENWLYEAMTETYIPLVSILENLVADDVDFRICLSFSPPLVEMLNDELLMDRYQRYLCRLIELTKKEISRNRKHPRLRELGIMYRDRFLKIQHSFVDVYKKNLMTAFRGLTASEKVEIITSSATHAYLPALMSEPVAVKAQIELAVAHFEKFFGKKPSGIWLPECGFTPEMDGLLKGAGLGYFFLESHGVLDRMPSSREYIYSPVKTRSGLTVFARDTLSSRQVWSSQEGYPGDPDYRDFYRDIGFDLALEYIGPYLPDGLRTFTGIKYFRVTGNRTDRKKTYNRGKALRKAEFHAGHFLKSREEQMLYLSKTLGIAPLITAAFDAELFGHWWFEGPEWLDYLLRKGSINPTVLRFTTPSEFIAEHRRANVLTPGLSSWGQEGYSATWIDPSNSWVYKHLHRAAKRMKELSQKNTRARGLAKRALNQAARELMLAQASDWAFMMRKEKASAFATGKFTEHMTNFSALYHQISSGNINREYLVGLERKNNIFSDIDFRVYAR
jgi:1,4-alpha-glucan branching enzyme